VLTARPKFQRVGGLEGKNSNAIPHTIGGTLLYTIPEILPRTSTRDDHETSPSDVRYTGPFKEDKHGIEALTNIHM